MADFDQFASADQQTQGVEEDPAAAFLAREQNELAGLEDDNFGIETSDQQAHSEQDGMDPFGVQDVEDVGSDHSGDFFAGGPQEGYGHTHEVIDHDLTNGPSEGYSAITQVDNERQEPEKITAWREEQLILLEKKDAEEEVKKKEWTEIAKKELDDWYKHHTDQLSKTKENNRASEQVFVKERDQTEPGGEWEKICRLCEFNPKNSKNIKDVSRLRSILLQLKQTPLVR